MLSFRFIEIAKSLTTEEWEILAAALAEFGNSDRWDEFDMTTWKNLFGNFAQAKP